MAKKDDGKKFEQDFKNSIPPDVYHYRLKDDTAGFYGVSNPCDYLLFLYPVMMLLELKSTKGKSLPLSRIRPNQMQGLKKATEYSGIYGGFILNFRDVEETYYLSLDTVEELVGNEERKSIPIDYCREYGELIPQNKKITRYTYELIPLIERRAKDGK